MKRVKKLAAAVCSLLLVMCMFYGQAWAEQAACSIENKADKAECGRNGEIFVSVILKGSSSSAEQKISSLRGTLEYDSSLFTVDKADILPVEGGKVQSVSFDRETGMFEVIYGADITVKQEELLLQLRLHVASDSSLGKTTVCVTHIEWNTPDSLQPVSVEHRVPVRIIIAEPEILPGDVNQDGRVDRTDAKLVMQYYNGRKKLNSRQKKCADVNGDGKVNLTDAKLIMKYFNGDIAGF